MAPHDSARQFNEWRQHSSYLSDAALFEEVDFNLGTTQNLLWAHIAQTSWNFFSLFGAHPVLGRAFHPCDDTPGRNNIAVIAYGLWQQIFAGDPRAVGSPIRVNGMPLTVVGVAPSDSHIRTRPFSGQPRNSRRATTVGNGRAAQTRRHLIAGALPSPRNSSHRIATTCITSRIPQDYPAARRTCRPHEASLVAAPSAVAIILLIACTNLANLLLARISDRST